MVEVRRMGEDPDPERRARMPRVHVILEDGEIDVLRSLPDRLRELLLDPTGAHRIVERLFPTVHRTDPREEAEYRRLLGETLLDRRVAALDGFAETLDGGQPRKDEIHVPLTESQVDLWLHVLNDFRLLLGTELDIQDNDWSSRGPDRPEDWESFVLLCSLSALQQDLIEALQGGSPGAEEA